MNAIRPTVLVLAGRDPTGGAGVDADREALEAHGVSARCVVTAETEQDGQRVAAIRPRAVKEWLGEALAVIGGDAGARPRAIKSGLLPGAEHVRALARLTRGAPDIPLVVDPVLAASGGEVFLDEAGIAALLTELLPLGPILTPNLPEAARLVSSSAAELDSREGRLRAAQQLLEAGARAVLLKGGHGSEDPVCDLVLERGAEPVWHEHPRVHGASLHGSGCRHAACVAAGLASGRSLPRAADDAGRYLAALIRSMADGATHRPE